MTDNTKADAQASKTPVQDLLRAIPKDHVIQFETDRGHWHNCPIGRLAHKAADIIQSNITPTPKDVQGLVDRLNSSHDYLIHKGRTVEAGACWSAAYKIQSLTAAIAAQDKEIVGLRETVQSLLSMHDYTTAEDGERIRKQAKQAISGEGDDKCPECGLPKGTKTGSYCMTCGRTSNA